MENKMTDNEIIKALKCCANRKKCSECPLCVTSTVPCSVRLTAITLDLINRQKAEVEKLCTEIDDLIIAKDLLFDEAEALIKKAKSEAIEEFANKTYGMIAEIYNKHIFGNCDLYDEEKDAIINFSDDITYGFDNIVKEMVGE